MKNNQDWVGQYESIFRTMGASNHSKEDREQNDYYATDPEAGKMLLQLEELDHYIWEPAAGAGHLSKVFEEAGHYVRSTDLFDRGYGESGIDFLQQTETWNGDIVTNPPYKYCQEFIKKAISLVSIGKKVIMFMKVQFLEGKSRRKLFEEFPMKTVYVSSSRILCAKNGDFETMKKRGGSAVAYAWYVWEKGFKGDTVLKWFN